MTVCAGSDISCPPGHEQSRAEIVATAANLGGIGVGALIAGVLAQWVGGPLTVPYLMFLVLMAAAAVGLALTPETRIVAAADRPPYRPQHVKAPAQARGRFYAALTGAFIAAAAMGFFTSLVAVEPAAPSLWLFLAGGALIGIGGGTYFKSALTTVLLMSHPANRAGTLASVYLAAYLGMAIPVVGLGVLVQHIAAGTALLIFGLLLVTGVSATARSMSRGRSGRQRHRSR